MGGQPPVHFLRPGGVDVAGAQAGFDVGDRNFGVEGGEGSGEGRGRVALDQHAVWLEVLIDVAQPFQHRGGHVGQALAVAHQIQVAVRRDGEQSEHLVEHLPVLRRDADQRGDPRRFRQAADDGSHLDGLGPGAEDR